MMTKNECMRELRVIECDLYGDSTYCRRGRIGNICMLLCLALTITTIVFIRKIFGGGILFLSLITVLPIGIWACRKILEVKREKQMDTEAYEHYTKERLRLNEMLDEIRKTELEELKEKKAIAEAAAREADRIKREAEEQAAREFENWYNGLSEQDRRTYDTNQSQLEEMRQLAAQTKADKETAQRYYEAAQRDTYQAEQRAMKAQMEAERRAERAEKEAYRISRSRHQAAWNYATRQLGMDNWDAQNFSNMF